jgi:hypothetical protein
MEVVILNDRFGSSLIAFFAFFYVLSNKIVDEIYFVAHGISFLPLIRLLGFNHSIFCLFYVLSNKLVDEIYFVAHGISFLPLRRLLGFNHYPNVQWMYF